jgi:hypothetical protein
VTPTRAALIKLLWRIVVDYDDGIDQGCVCEPDATGAEDVTDVCEAMRALGWGEHWDAERFQILATNGTVSRIRNRIGEK